MDSSRLGYFGLSELLLKYPGLRVKPSRDGNILLQGALAFTAVTPGYPEVTDTYEVKILVPKDYPEELPVVHETAGRIPPDFHKLSGDALCLGSPLRLRLLVQRRSSLLNFIERVVVPYFYGYSSHEQGRGMPFGELSHGSQGLIEDLAEMLGSIDLDTTKKYLQAIQRKKRVANKFPCPCGSGRRLGRCHNRLLNGLRIAITGRSLRKTNRVLSIV